MGQAVRHSSSDKMGKMNFLLAVFALAQASALLTKQNELPPIDWANIEPRLPTFTPWNPKEKLPEDLLRNILNMDPPTSERHPGYKKGTKSFAGECGVAGEKEGRIVGGEEATPHSYPWMAALFVDGKWFCGGTLISDEWVLTAAHCAKDASEMRVMLGAHNVREASEEGRIELVTTDFFTHERYSQFNLHNDLALVHLPERVTFTDTIKPVCLPSYSESSEAWAHEDCQASGWGKPADSSDSISPVLRHVTVDTITNLMCALEFPTVINKNIICISGKHGKSTCNGDSGGPLHLVTDGVHKQIGITSFGSGAGCELGFHAGFTRTASFLEWIETNTGIQIDN